MHAAMFDGRHGDGINDNVYYPRMKITIVEIYISQLLAIKKLSLSTFISVFGANLRTCFKGGCVVHMLQEISR